MHDGLEDPFQCVPADVTYPAHGPLANLLASMAESAEDASVRGHGEHYPTSENCDSFDHCALSMAVVYAHLCKNPSK